MRKINNTPKKTAASEAYEILQVYNTILTTRFYCEYLGFESLPLSGNNAGNAFSLLKFENTRIAIYPGKPDTEESDYRKPKIKMYIAHEDIKKLYLDLSQKVSLFSKLQKEKECDGCLTFSVLDCEDNVLKYVAAY